MAASQVDPRVNDEMTRVQLRLVKEKLQQQRKNLSGKEEKVHDDADTRLDKVIKRRDELISRIRQEHKLRDELEGRPRSVENSLPPEPIQIMPAPVMPAVYPPVPPYVYPLSPRKPSGKKDSMKDFIMYQNSQMQQMLLQQLMGRGEKQGYELGDLLKLLPLGGQPTEKGRTVHHHYYQQPSTFPPQNNWPPYPMLPPIGQPAQPPPMNGQPMGFNMNTFQSATVPPLTDNTQPYNPYMGYQASELSETESIPKRSPSDFPSELHQNYFLAKRLRSRTRRGLGLGEIEGES